MRRFRFESKLLSEFWGRRIHLGATVLLPRDYDRETISYPVVYVQGHFSLADPMTWKEGEDFYRAWTSDHFPRMIVVTIQDPNPYFDTSYSVNSVNVGPYGDAIQDELIPEIERRFRDHPETVRPGAHRRVDGRMGSARDADLPPGLLRRRLRLRPRSRHLRERRGDRHLQGRQRVLQAARVAAGPHRQHPVPDGRGATHVASRGTGSSSSRGREGDRASSSTSGPRSSGRSGRTVTSNRSSTRRTGRIDRAVAEHWRENFDLLHHLKNELGEPRAKACLEAPRLLRRHGRLLP